MAEHVWQNRHVLPGRAKKSLHRQRGHEAGQKDMEWQAETGTGNGRWAHEGTA